MTNVNVIGTQQRGVLRIVGVSTPVDTVEQHMENQKAWAMG